MQSKIIINDFQLFIILGFDSIERKTKLIFIGLIKKNIKTFTIIIRYLKDNYKFQPKFIICDCSLAEMISIRKEFPLCKIILYYFHIIQNCIRKLPQLRNKNKDLKKRALDLLAYIKFILFINEINIEVFFKKIIKAFKSDFFKFIKYFYKNYFIKFPMNERIWNFNNNLLLSFDNPNLIFMTNNIC